MSKHEAYDEFRFIEWARRQTGAAEDILIGIGDDAAHLACAGGSFLATTDMLLEGTHFVASAGWQLIGRKAMAVSLSDMAAMAARPRFALCAVALSRERKARDAKQIFQGMSKVAADFGCQVVGGDLTSWGRPTVICTTVLGEPTGAGPLTRNGAKVADKILVTGELGGSAGGKHLRFTPRVREAIYLNQNYKVHSCIDVSDGLGLDLSHILKESGVGAVIDCESLPVSDAARKASAGSGKTPLKHALSDGEDFELLFTMPVQEAQRLATDSELATLVSIIGEITAGGLRIRDASGKVKKYHPEGYVHLLKK